MIITEISLIMNLTSVEKDNGLDITFTMERESCCKVSCSGCQTDPSTRLRIHSYNNIDRM